MAKWYDEQLTRCYISQHYEDHDDQIFADYDVNKLIKAYELSECETVICTARTHNGKWFANVGMGQMHKGLHGTNQLENVLAHFHDMGKKVVAYFSAVYDAQAYDEHPDWRQRNQKGKAFCSTENPSGKVVCLNSGYRQEVTKQLQALTSQYAVDGVLVDMPFFDTRLCYCKACQDHFFQKYGRPLPTQTTDEDMPLFLQMRNEDNQSFIDALCKAAKTTNPELPVYVQFAMMKKDSITAQTLAYAKTADYVYDDLYIKQSGTISWTVYPKMCIAMTNHRPEIGMMVRPGGHDDCPQMKTLSQLTWEAATILASGCGIHFFDIMWANGDVQLPMFERIGKVAKLLQQGAPYVQGDNAAQIGVFYSETDRLTRLFEDIDSYETRLLGMCRMLTETQKPYRFVTDFSTQTLKGIKVLVIVDTQYLIKEQTQNIDAFVKQGGCVITTGAFAQKSTKEVQELTQALQGCKAIQTLGAGSKAFINACEEPEALWMTAWGGTQQLESIGADLFGRVMLPLYDANENRMVNVMSNPPARKTEAKAYAVHTHGKGTIITVPFSPDGDYLRIGLYEQRQFVNQLIDQLLPTPNVKVDAPECVEVNLYEKQDELWIHLTNGQTENGKTYTMGAFADKGQPIAPQGFESRHIQRQMLDVHHVGITLQKEAVSVSSVYGSKVHVEGKQVTIDTLHEYEIILIKWEG